MNRTMFVAVGLVTGLLTSAANAQSAVLTQVQGNVLVNTGSGFTPAGNGTAVQVGNQVTVQGPGNATIDFGNGQTLSVPGSSTVVVRVPAGGIPTVSTTAVVGGVAVAGAVAGAIAISQSDGKNIVWPPVSP